MKNTKTSKKAISIIETIIFIGIIIIIITTAISAINYFGAKLKKASLIYNLNLIRGALEEYAKNNGKYPKKLTNLLSDGNGTFRYLSHIPIDPTTNQIDWELKRGSSTPKSITNGLVAYYPLRAGIGNIAYDNTGNFNDATLFNGVKWTKDGYIDYALIFDGIDDYMYLDHTTNNDNPTFDSTFEKRSISIWIYPYTLPTGISDYMFIYEEGDGSNGINIYLKQEKIFIGAWSEQNGWNGSWLSSNSITPNNWYHVCLIFDFPNREFKGFVNGIHFGSTQADTPIYYHYGDDAVGALVYDSKTDSGDLTQSLGFFFNGIIDEIRIYNRSLNTEEVHLLYNGIPQAQWYEYNNEDFSALEILDVRSNNEKFKNL